MNDTSFLHVVPALVRRRTDDAFEALVFEADGELQVPVAPMAGAPAKAAAAALADIAGVEAPGPWLDLGRAHGIARDEGAQGQSWHFMLATCPPLADAFAFGGRAFLWQPLEEWLGTEWGDRHVRALRFLQTRLEKLDAARLARHCPQPDTRIADAIRSRAAERGAAKTICPSEVARALGGTDETVWRGLMKPIRAEALRLAAAGEVRLLRKGKPVEGADFKGIYRIQTVE